MNTNQLKKFAQEARIKLIEQVGAKLSFVLTADTAVLREQAGQLKQLREELNRTTKQQLIEKVAYTWFNRLMALRFMDANDYQPLGIRVITPKEGYTLPEMLDEAKRGNIPEELRLNRQRVYDLLDNRIPSSNPQNEAFKELLIASCNHLHSTFPFLFERINDYTELLMPDDLTSDFSIVTQVRNGMPADDCKNVEIIGWLYQFYISEKKDEVFASKEKVKKEDIPAATQLFTPRWIVEYMVQNTVGKLWLQNNPKSRLREHMPYFIESVSLTADDYLKISSPEEIRLLDPASGSGHILVYGFDLFTKIYEEQGYNTSDIPKLIIEKNLYGFEIDERAAQLTALALMMKAREYQRRAFRKDIKPIVFCFQDLRLTTGEIKESLRLLSIRVSDELIHDLNQMQQATNFGSLIIPHSHSTEIQQVGEKLKQLLTNADVFQRNKIEELVRADEQLKALAEKYHCVVTNPPYLGSRKMEDATSQWLKDEGYSDVSRDLYSSFIKRCITSSMKMGLTGMITQISWMFTNDFKKFRTVFVEQYHLESSIILGSGAFETISGEVVKSCVFTIQNNKSNYLTIFIDLSKTNDKESELHKSHKYLRNINIYKKLNHQAFAYKLNEKSIDIVSQSKLIEDFIDVKQGLATGNNDRFVRFYWEIENKKFAATASNYKFGIKWYPYDKGGGYHKYYGNYLNVVDWDMDGDEIKNFKDANGSLRSRPQNESFYFKEGLTFNLTGRISFRYKEQGHIFDVQGSSLFLKKESNLTYQSFCGFLNSKLAGFFTELTNPTMVTQVGDINSIPIVIPPEDTIIYFDKLSNSNILNSFEDWNKFESAWGFTKCSLIINLDNHLRSIDEIYGEYTQKWRRNFYNLHQNEEKINSKFIEIYGLRDELSPDIPLEDITILQDELDRKALVKLNKKFVRDPETHQVLNYNEIELPFIPQEIMAQFISYSVGCMFGRYSLDKDGLVLANQGETLQDYLQKIGKSAQECSFLPDEDNIIPILDNEWFEDDIVGRFHQFLKVTFDEKNFNKNLAFIEEQIGKDIRSYFIRDFYSDHIQRYRKRPIYWMFSSPKGYFNALIYMHRYTPDTVSNILNKYLKEFIGKLHTRKEHLQRVQISGSPSEKTKAIKETDSIDKMLIELQEYERDVLFPLATERISIDLDDGVLVNYNKFGKAVKEVSGLNDKQTKDKVRKFDWIDTTQIR
ncbi:MAG: BREX-1 system adenine-specific DNA-methyltransferase PglX [Bacteroidales bacterium]|nr:BREX-1 system adenine-specific DNA-methyltransferase PglX [Bacteroidales bacterium]